MQTVWRDNVPTERLGWPARARWIAWGVWALVLAVPSLLIALGRIRAIPFGEYMGAGRRWLSHEPLYDLGSIDGFQYFPHAALLFAPLAWLGSPLSDLLFRLLGWTAYACGILRWARRLAPERPDQAFMLATLLAVGPAVGNLINGQANLLIAALALHVSIDLAERSWWRASALLAVGLALKPLMGVPLLLAWALYAPLRWRLPLALALVLGAPWLIADHAYLTTQSADCIAKLRLSAQPDRLFEDLRGLLVTLGLSISAASYTAIRALAAVATLALGARAKRQLAEPRASFMICALGLTYLMLFNPRTLSSSYVMPGASAALLGAHCILTRQKRYASVLLSIVLAWSVNHHVVPWVEYWLRPLASMIFFALLLVTIVRPRARLSGEPGQGHARDSRNDSPLRSATACEQAHPPGVGLTL